MKKGPLSLLLAAALLCPLALTTLGATADTGFTDVAADAWYADAVEYVSDNNLMGGTSATAFEPGTTTSRAMLVTILYRQDGSPAAQAAGFPDVEAGVWYANAAGWASANGIVSGYSDGRFAPSDPVTREQLATILWRAEGTPAPGGAEPFADQAAIASYATSAVAWARESGIIGGKSGNRFDPAGLATRAETAAILHRYLGGGAPTPTPTPVPIPDEKEDAAMPKLTIQAGGQTFTATLVDNATTRALLERLPLMVNMGELNGNEKYYNLPNSLPTNAQNPGRIQTGDLMLFGSDCVVLFYESFSTSYSYTRLGSLDDPTGLAGTLGSGSVEVTFRID